MKSATDYAFGLVIALAFYACADGSLPLSQRGAENSEKSSIDSQQGTETIQTVDTSLENRVPGDENSSGAEPGQSGAPAPRVQPNSLGAATASEPVSVGGAYLTCAIDRQITSAQLGSSLSAQELGVGCSLFSDSNYAERKSSDGFNLLGARIVQGNVKSPIGVIPSPAHPRWSWLLKIAATEASRELRWDINYQGTSYPGFKVIVRETIPGSLLVGMTFSEGSFAIAAAGKGGCFGGDPHYDFVFVNGAVQSTKAQPLTLVPCETAPHFKWTAWQGGYRIHMFNPNPVMTTCDANYYEPSLCDRSCVDLTNSGIGNRFELFACSLSVAAQSAKLTLSPSSPGSVRLKFNDRAMGLNTANIFAPTDAPAQLIDLEFISYP